MYGPRGVVGEVVVVEFSDVVEGRGERDVGSEVGGKSSRVYFHHSLPLLTILFF